MTHTHPIFYFIFFPILIFTTGALLSRIAPAYWLDDANRNKNLEGLRGLLAPTVFFHHAITTFYFSQTQAWHNPPSAFYTKLGSGPVLLFFFMTGFLFWNQALSKQGPFSFRDFMIKRLRRLAPGYYVSLALLIFIVFYVTGMTFATDGLTLVKSVSSWILFGLPFGDFKPINGFAQTIYVNAGIAWTLQFEWIFYFLFTFIRRFSTLTKYVFFVFLLYILKHILDIREIQLIFESSPFLLSLFNLYKDFFFFMAIGFNFGIFTSFFNIEKVNSAMSQYRFRILGLAALVLYFFADSIPHYSMLGSSLLFIFFANIVLDKSVTHFLHWRGFQILGHLSFSFYLLHGIGLFASFRGLSRYTQIATISPLSYWSLVFGIGLVVVFISYFFYRYIEYPFLKSKRKSA